MRRCGTRRRMRSRCWGRDGANRRRLNTRGDRGGRGRRDENGSGWRGKDGRRQRGLMSSRRTRVHGGERPADGTWLTH